MPFAFQAFAFWIGMQTGRSPTIGLKRSSVKHPKAKRRIVVERMRLTLLMVLRRRMTIRKVRRSLLQQRAIKLLKSKIPLKAV